MGKRYDENRNKPLPVELCGPCPECGSEENKIQWGFHGVYYDLVCLNEHLWTYNFPNVIDQKPWEKPNDHGELPGGICCQRASGKYCFEHDPSNYSDSEGIAMTTKSGMPETPEDYVSKTEAYKQGYSHGQREERERLRKSRVEKASRFALAGLMAHEGVSMPLAQISKHATDYANNLIEWLDDLYQQRKKDE